MERFEKEVKPMRKWLIEETGEFREPKKGEYFLIVYGDGESFGLSGMDHTSSDFKRAILRVSDITDCALALYPRERKPCGFDEWNW